MNKYKIKFKYLDSGRSSFKYIYANSQEEAISAFEEIYKMYFVEITSIELIKKESTS